MTHLKLTLLHTSNCPTPSFSSCSHTRKNTATEKRAQRINGSSCSVPSLEARDNSPMRPMALNQGAEHEQKGPHNTVKQHATAHSGLVEQACPHPLHQTQRDQPCHVEGRLGAADRELLAELVLGATAMRRHQSSELPHHTLLGKRCGSLRSSSTEMETTTIA